MPIEDFIIITYIFVDKFLKEVSQNLLLRSKREVPALSNAEVITTETAGEYMSLGSDKQIWSYFRQDFIEYSPKLGCKTSFVRQSANLITVKSLLQQAISSELTRDKGLFMFDGFPIPICHIKRYKRSTTTSSTHAKVSYCAAKDDKYFGFKGHLIITQKGVTKVKDITLENIDERDVLPKLVGKVFGDIIADKGLIRPELSLGLKSQGFMAFIGKDRTKSTNPYYMFYAQQNCKPRKPFTTGSTGDLIKNLHTG